jgi:hypothetical protein
MPANLAEDRRLATVASYLASNTDELQATGSMHAPPARCSMVAPIGARSSARGRGLIKASTAPLQRAARYLLASELGPIGSQRGVLIGLLGMQGKPGEIDFRKDCARRDGPITVALEGEQWEGARLKDPHFAHPEPAIDFQR